MRLRKLSTLRGCEGLVSYIVCVVYSCGPPVTSSALQFGLRSLAFFLPWRNLSTVLLDLSCCSRSFDLVLSDLYLGWDPVAGLLL